MRLSTALVACLAALSWTPAQIEAFGRSPGFAGSTFRHSVNNLRPEVQRTNRNAFGGAMRETFKSPADIPTNKLSAYGTAVQFGGNLHKNGYGSQGMGSWWDEMDDEDDDVESRQLFQRRLEAGPFMRHRQLRGERRLSLQKKYLDICEKRCDVTWCKKKICIDYKRYKNKKGYGKQGSHYCTKYGVDQENCLQCQENCVMAAVNIQN
jgi:hypothetical protein